jgi:hypothetical protein
LGRLGFGSACSSAGRLALRAGSTKLDRLGLVWQAGFSGSLGLYWVASFFFSLLLTRLAHSLVPTDCWGPLGGLQLDPVWQRLDLVRQLRARARVCAAVCVAAARGVLKEMP